MRNPDKYIRKAITAAWKVSRPGIPIFEGAVPSSEDTPDKFVLINSLDKYRTAESKAHYEWRGSVQVMCVSIKPKGFIVSSEVDDMEEVLIPLMEKIEVDGFRVNYCKFERSVYSNIEAPAESVTRKVTTFEMWLNKAE